MKNKILVFVVIFIVSSSLSNAIKIITVNETDFVSLKPKATDQDKDTLIYTFTEPLDKNGQWQTRYGDAGEYRVNVTVSDMESSTSKEILLIVKKKNIKPNIDFFSPENMELSMKEGEEISFNIKASDLNKDFLKYEWKVNGNIVSEEEIYKYVPYYGDAGAHKIKVIVSDGEEEIEKEWNVNVAKVDREALLRGVEGITVNEGEIVKLKLPDFKKYNLEYSISDPIGEDNYWETTYEDNGRYSVEIMVKDKEFIASKTIEVIITDKDRAPIFKPIATVWVRENQKITIELEAYDPDNDKIEFSAENLPNGASLNGNRFEWVTDYNTVKKESALNKALDRFHVLYKPFKITFKVKSKEFEVKQNALIIVKDVNRAPVLKDIPAITVNEGEEVVIKPEASDADGDSITYYYSGWSEADRYKTDYDDAGAYKIKVIASDGFLEDEKYVTINVNNINRAPVLGEIIGIEVKEGERLELKIYATDPDGDGVSVSLGDLLKNATIKDNTFVWAPDYDTVDKDKSVFTIKFKASDGKDETIKEGNIIVYNANKIPEVISAKPDKRITVDKKNKVLFEINATDPDGDKLSYLWKFGLLEEYKAGSSIVRRFTVLGDKKVNVIISDGKDETKYEWEVKVV